MVELMPENAPERLFRPDVSITAWRRLCEHARGEAPAAAPLAEQLAAASAEVEQAAADRWALGSEVGTPKQIQAVDGLRGDAGWAAWDRGRL